MCFVAVKTDEYNGPLEATHAHIDDDRYDMVDCGAASQIKFDLIQIYEWMSSLVLS